MIFRSTVALATRSFSGDEPMMVPASSTITQSFFEAFSGRIGTKWSGSFRRNTLLSSATILLNRAMREALWPRIHIAVLSNSLRSHQPPRTPENRKSGGTEVVPDQGPFPRAPSCLRCIHRGGIEVFSSAKLGGDKAGKVEGLPLTSFIPRNFSHGSFSATSQCPPASCLVDL